MQRRVGRRQALVGKPATRMSDYGSMEWLPLVSTALGAVIALSGSLLTSMRSGRDQLDREREAHRRQAYLDFAAGLNSAHAALRAVIGAPATSEHRRALADAAVGESGLYRVREQLLMLGSATVATAGESAFLALIEVRDVARTTTGLDSEAYHDAYHQLASELWNFRVVVRADVGERPFTSVEFGRSDWSERHECVLCRSRAAPGGGADP